MTTPVVGGLVQVTHQAVDGMGAFDACVCWLSGGRFLVSHQLEDVGTDGFSSNPSYLSYRLVDVATSLTVGSPIISEVQSENSTEVLLRIDATRALSLYRVTTDSEHYRARVITVAGDAIALGPEQTLVGAEFAIAHAVMARDDVLFVYYYSFFQAAGLLMESYRVAADSGDVTLLDSATNSVLFTPSYPPGDFPYYEAIQKLADGQVVMATNKTDYAVPASQVLLQPVLVDVDGTLTTGAAVQSDVTSSAFVSGSRTVAITDDSVYVLQDVTSDTANFYRFPVTYDWLIPSLSLGTLETVGPFNNEIWGYVQGNCMSLQVAGQLVMPLEVLTGSEQFPRLLTATLTPAGVSQLASPVLTSIASPSPDDYGQGLFLNSAAGPVFGLTAVTGYEVHLADYPTDDDERIYYDLYLQGFRVGGEVVSAYVDSTVRFD